MLSGLRPAPRLLLLVALGLVFAVAALASQVALYALVGWDLLLSVAFLGLLAPLRGAHRRDALDGSRAV